MGRKSTACHGDNEEDVYRQLCRILDEWIEIYSDDNMLLPSGIADKKFSGKFQLRVDSDLHKALVIKAMQSNESLNSFCGKALRKTILQTGHLKANNSMNSDC